MAVLTKCPSCKGTGKITVRQKAQRRDGDADYLNPKAGEFWHVTYYPDGSVVERLQKANS